MTSILVSTTAKKGKAIVTGIIMIILLSTMVGCQKQAQTPAPPSNAETSYNCSVSQGFKFQKDQQNQVGFIESLKIGTSQLDADFTVTDPMDTSKTIKVVGIVSNICWNGGYADPILFTSQVSTTNKNVIATLMHKSLDNTEVEVKFSIYDYDPKTKAYYKCFHSNSSDLQGLIQKSGGDLVMAVDMDQSMEVASPKNYAFTLGVMPQDINQSLYLAVSNTDKFQKKWGVEVAK